jgi:hypothetical protein
VRLAGMSALTFFEPSLSTHFRYSLLPKPDIQNSRLYWLAGSDESGHWIIVISV